MIRDAIAGLTGNSTAVRSIRQRPKARNGRRGQHAGCTAWQDNMTNSPRKFPNGAEAARGRYSSARWSEGLGCPCGKAPLRSGAQQRSRTRCDKTKVPRADRPLEQLQHGFGTPIGKDPAAYNACGVVGTVLTVFDRTISAGDGPRRVPSRQHTILQDDGQTLSEQPCLCSARTRD
jgi:hypothetical protein